MAAIVGDNHAELRRPSVEDLADVLRQLSVQDNQFPDTVDPKVTKRIDRKIAMDLLHVPAEDRNAILEEVHGVSTLAPPESPEFLEDALDALSREISSIPDTNPLKEAYNESQIFPQTYVNTPDFRLRFLRCELFDVKKAAIRMLTFLDLGLDIYGPEVLRRPPQLKDLTKEELEWMKRGFFQVLPFRDRAGRSIFAAVGHFGSRSTFVENIGLKVVLYEQYIMTNDVETQQKGAVKLAWDNSGRSISVDAWLSSVQRSRKFYDASPLRTAAIHWCVPNTAPYQLIQVVYGWTTRGSNTSRRRFHSGEVIERLYNLKSYGIPVEVLPVRDDDSVQTKFWHQWIQFQRKVESGPNPGPSIFICPGSNDVIFRKGNSLLYHPGNALFRDYIESSMQEHSTATQTQKRMITYSIIQKVQDKGGRFLEWNKKGWWTELNGEQTQTKVSNQVRLFKFKPVAATVQKVRSSTDLFQNQDNSLAKRRKVFHHSDGSDSENNCECACFI